MHRILLFLFNYVHAMIIDSIEYLVEWRFILCALYNNNYYDNNVSDFKIPLFSFQQYSCDFARVLNVYKHNT